MAKLNLGCGFDKRPGFVNADAFPQCDPDVLFDMESGKWPFEDGTFEYILMKHVLEHVGESFSKFKFIMQELYRISSPDAIIEIHVPHYRHETFWSDPTHVRHFTALTFKMMSKAQNDIWIKERANYSMIAYAMDVDFETVWAGHIYDDLWLQRENSGEFDREELRQIAAERWGVIRELQVKLRAVK